MLQFFTFQIVAEFFLNVHNVAIPTETEISDICSPRCIAGIQPFPFVTTSAVYSATCLSVHIHITSDTVPLWDVRTK